MVHNKYFVMNCHQQNWGQFILRYKNGRIIIIISIISLLN